MAAGAWHVKHNVADLQKKLDEIERRILGGVETWLKRISVWQLSSVDKNWRQAGRRYMSGGWAPISELTYAMRQWGHKKFNKPSAVTHKILEVGGQLRGRGWEYALSGGGVNMQSDVGTNNPNADKLHKGGTFPKPAWAKWKTRSSVTVPARTLVAIVEDDMRWARKLADDMLREDHR